MDVRDQLQRSRDILDVIYEQKGMRKTTTDIVLFKKPSPKSTPRPKTGSVREPVKNAIQVYKNGETKKVAKKKEEEKSLPKRPQSREEKLRLDFQRTKTKKYAPAPTTGDEPERKASRIGVTLLDPDDIMK